MIRLLPLAGAAWSSCSVRFGLWLLRGLPEPAPTVETTLSAAPVPLAIPHRISKTRRTAMRGRKR